MQQPKDFDEGAGNRKKTLGVQNRRFRIADSSAPIPRKLVNKLTRTYGVGVYQSSMGQGVSYKVCIYVNAFVIMNQYYSD